MITWDHQGNVSNPDTTREQVWCATARYWRARCRSAEITAMVLLAVLLIGVFILLLAVTR